MTFNRDGTVSGAAKSPVTGPFDTPEHGIWKREQGPHKYSFPEVSPERGHFENRRKPQLVGHPTKEHLEHSLIEIAADLAI
jgi:hypothetical protein